MPEFYHVTPYKNWKRIQKKGLVPRRGKRGIHADDPKEPRIYLFESLDTADDALTNWMTDWYPEDRYFAIIRVKVYGTIRVYEDPELAGAVYVRSPIPPEQLALVKKQDAGEPEEYAPEPLGAAAPKGDGWVWAYHVSPEQFIPSIVENGLRPTLHPHVPGGVPVLFVEPDLAGVEPYWGPGMALFRFKTPGFATTGDGETVLFGGAPPFVGDPGAIPPGDLFILVGKRFQKLVP